MNLCIIYSVFYVPDARQQYMYMYIFSETVLLNKKVFYLITVCKPELYLPFSKNFIDYSGNKREVISHGVKLTREGYAYFDGDSYLEIKKFLNFEQSEITVAVRFLKENKGGLTVVMSNSISEPKPTFLILNSAKNVHAMIKNTGNEIFTLHGVTRVST